MLFFEFTFLFLFLPVTLAVYYLVRARWQNGWLLFASLLFYAASSFVFLPILLTSTLVDFVAGRQISRASSQKRRKAFLLASLCVNLALLGFFKYVGLVTGTLRAILGDSVPLVEAALPVGISFYTFQSMSYTIDLYRGKVEPVRSLRDFGAFVTLFPQLIAGPIVRYSEMQEQLLRRTFSEERFATGVFLLVVGLAKKLLVADTLAGLSADWTAASHVGFLEAWAGMLMYSGQIYFDFSGYSDMAIGLGRMLGFEFPVNFDSPYKAHSFSNFWRRWHITLSSWLRDYLYVPLGGNRRGPVRTYVNLALTMLLGGLWHGASWNFVLWGAAHGSLLAVERYLGEPNPLLRLPLWAQRLAVFLIVTIVWVPFKFEHFSQTGTWLGAMLLGLGGLGSVGWHHAAALVGMGVLFWAFPNTNTLKIRFTPTQTALAVGLLVASLVVGYGRHTPSPFLYFRF